MSGDPNLAAVSSLLRARHRVLRRLPWNGLALVYLAERRDGPGDGATPGRRVAVALLPIDCERAPALAERFHAEAARLRAIDDPHVVPITDHGIAEGVPWLELRWESAPTLGELLASPDGGVSHFSRDRALDVTRQLLRGLGALHAAGVPHWDVTPSNVLLAIDAHGWEQVRLVGAGIGALVRRVEEGATAGRARHGSGPAAHRYLAPELLEGRPADDRADVYSAGALLLHLLAGTLPAPGTPPADALPGERDVAEVIARATAPRPSDRYASARGMLAAVDDPASESAEELGEPTRQVPALDGRGTPSRSAGSLAPVSSGARRPSADPGAPAGGLRWLGAAAAVLLGMAVAAGVVVAAGRDGAQPTTAARPAPTGLEGPARDPSPATAEATTPGAPAAVAGGAATAEAEAERPELGEATGAGTAEGALAGDAPAEIDGAPDDAAHAGAAGDATPQGDVASAGAVDMVFDVDEAPTPAGDPLAGPLPDELGTYHPRIAAGADLTRDEVSELYGYLSRHPDDVRAHLVLGHAFMNLGWRADALDRYRSAGRVDAAAAAGDPRLLPDLLELLRYDDHHVEAGVVIREIFAAAALPLVRTAYETEPRWTIRARLQTLERRLARSAEREPPPDDAP